jgi:hypothetical protein
MKLNTGDANQIVNMATNPGASCYNYNKGPVAGIKFGYNGADGAWNFNWLNML